MQAKRIVDCIVFLYPGELVEHGPAEEVFTNPKGPKTGAHLTAEISQLKKESLFKFGADDLFPNF